MTKGNPPCRRQRVMWVIALTIVIMVFGDIRQARAQSVDQAMQSFIQAIAQKNPKGILAAFSQQTPWQYQPYEIGTGRPLKVAVINPQKLVSDFKNKQGWYDFFLADPNGYTFRVNFMRHKPWKKRGPDTFVAPESDSGNTYVTWRREGERWVIAIIGETTP